MPPDKKKSKIIGRFVTELALPKERIACWIKYDESLTFDRIIISFDVGIVWL